MSSAPAPAKPASTNFQCVLGCGTLLGLGLAVGAAVGGVVCWLAGSWVWGLSAGGGVLVATGIGLVVVGALVAENPGKGDADEHGRQQGLWVWADRKGRKRREAHFRDGVAHGGETLYFADGRKRAEGGYLNGQRHGTWTAWDADGRPVSRVGWGGGKKNGPATWWRPDGRLWVEANYADDELHGPFFEWRPDGQPACRLTFYRGAPLEAGFHRFRDPGQLGVTAWGRVLFWTSWLFWGVVAVLFVTAIVRALGLGIALLALTAAILVHELGHFLAAKLAGIPIRHFQVGLGPALVRCWLGCTRFQLAPLPFWGYVAPYAMKPTELAYFREARRAMRAGEPLPPEPEAAPGEERQPSMELASRPRRLLFYAGGVLFNLLAAAVLLGLHFSLPQPGPGPVALIAAQAEQESEERPRLADPVGGLEEVGLEMAQHGWLGALEPLAVLNLILAVFNLLPVPPLDGYRCLLVLIGMAIRRDVPRKYLWPLNLLGCLIVVVLLVLNALWLLGEMRAVLFR